MNQLPVKDSTSAASAEKLDAAYPLFAASTQQKPDADSVRLFNSLMNDGQQTKLPGQDGFSQTSTADSLFASRTQQKPNADPTRIPNSLINGGQNADPALEQVSSFENSIKEHSDLPGSGLLDASSLFHNAFSLSPQTVEHVDAPSQPSLLREVDLETLVERILVSSAESGTKEVRLILGGDVLKGTEVIIQRDVLGALAIQLHAHDAAIFQTLVAAQGELKLLLESRMADPIQIIVDFGNGSGNDTERRSKGYFQQDNVEEA